MALDNKLNKKKILMIVAAIVLIFAAVIIFLYFRSRIRATTMRILRIEGEVTLEDNGKQKSITDNMRLSSGNALSTAVKSLVSIGLDDVKIVTLDEKSRAVFNQAGRELDLELTAGSLFFEVQKPLEADETMDIRTSTMIVGIRGTSGWVSVEGENESLIITDGVVHVKGTNPVTGEEKEIDVKAGQRINVYLYNDRKVDSIMFVIEEVTERELPEALLENLRENPELLEKVCRETGWDKPWILGMSDAEPTDTPIPVENEISSADNDATKVEEPTNTPTPEPTVTATPVLAKAPQKSDEEKLQEELEKMLALMTPTPTPTPTPWWMNQQEKKEEVREESEDEGEDKPQETATPTPTPEPTSTPTPTPTPTPSPSPTQAAPTRSSASFTYNGTTPAAVTVNGVTIGYIRDMGYWDFSVSNGADFSIPLDFNDSSGNSPNQPPKIEKFGDNLLDIKYPYRNYSQQDVKISDDNGNYVLYVGNSHSYTVHYANGNETTNLDDSGLENELKNANLWN